MKFFDGFKNLFKKKYKNESEEFAEQNSVQNNAEKKQKRKARRKIFMYFGLVFFLVLITVSYFLYDYVVSGLPSLEELENPKSKLASNVYSADGKLIGQFFRKNRIETDLDSIPSHVINALIATEDRKFYDHWGVNLERFAKAMIKTIFLFRKEGGSTITQQLAKNLYELKTYNENLFETGVRKLREWITSVQIEKTYTKDEILEMYFNISYFGQGAYGIHSAANIYFNKEPQDLTVTEGAILVSLLKSSVLYNPVRYPNRALTRRNLVLYNMVQTNYLDESKYDLLREEPIVLDMQRLENRFKSEIAPHFVEYVRQQLLDMSEKYEFDIFEDGLSIYTTLNTRMQEYANAAVDSHITEYQKLHDENWNWGNGNKFKTTILEEEIKKNAEYRAAENPQEKNRIMFRLKQNTAFVDSVFREKQKIEVGFVALEVKTGEIKALVGARDMEFAYGLNHVTQIKRQPGSSFKPVVYTVAIDNGLYPAYPLLNQYFEIEAGGRMWRPRNFSRDTGGFLTLRDALKTSKNIISARLVVEGHVSLWQIGQYANKMGINNKLSLTESIALGTSEVTPLEMVSVYSTIANKGIYTEPISILRIEDNDGILIDQFVPETREAISEETSYIMTDMLESVMDEGTGASNRYRYGFKEPAGGKTGTSQDYADAWFVGFTSHLAAAAWVGFDDRRITFSGNYGQGGKAALPIWGIFMHDVHANLDLPAEEFDKPKSGDIVMVDFCWESIYKYGNPKLYSNDCSTGKVSDIVNINNVPFRTFDSKVDTSVNLPRGLLTSDSLADHEAKPIVERPDSK